MVFIQCFSLLSWPLIYKTTCYSHVTLIIRRVSACTSAAGTSDTLMLQHDTLLKFSACRPQTIKSLVTLIQQLRHKYWCHSQSVLCCSSNLTYYFTKICIHKYADYVHFCLITLLYVCPCKHHIPYPEYDQNQDKANNRDAIVHVNAVTESFSFSVMWHKDNDGFSSRWKISR